MTVAIFGKAQDIFTKSSWVNICNGIITFNGLLEGNCSSPINPKQPVFFITHMNSHSSPIHPPPLPVQGRLLPAAMG